MPTCVCACLWVRRGSVSTQGIPDRQTGSVTDHTPLIPITSFAVILNLMKQTVGCLHSVSAAVVQLKLHYHAEESAADSLGSFLHRSPGAAASPAATTRSHLVIVLS